MSDLEHKEHTDPAFKEGLDQVSKAAMELLPYLGQLRKMDEEPEQAGRFLSTLVGEVMKLPADTTARLERTIADGYTDLKRDGLTLSSRPKENEENWAERREAADKALTARILAVLPQTVRDHPIFTLMGESGGILCSPRRRILEQPARRREGRVPESRPQRKRCGTLRQKAMKRVHILLSAVLAIAGAAVWFSQQVSEATSLRDEVESLRAENAAALQPGGAGECFAGFQRRSHVAQPANCRTPDGNCGRESGSEGSRKVARGSPAKATSGRRRRDHRFAWPDHRHGEGIGTSHPRRIRAVPRPEAPDSRHRAVPGEFYEVDRVDARDFGIRRASSRDRWFQAALLQEFFHLDGPRARQMEAILKTHFDALHAGQLTAEYAGQPTWKERRTAALTPLLWQLRPFIPKDSEIP